MKARPFPAELLIPVAVFVVGSIVGAAYWRVFVASGAQLEFAQSESGAAVALACGHGFVDPGYAPTPAMGEFLQLKRDRITCADLPPGTPLRPASFSQGLYRYMMSAIALVWMLSGVISWSGLTPLFAVVYGWTMAAAYGLFRLGTGRVMSLIATFALLVSSVHLGYLPFFRDYAKAPFILTLMLIMGRLAMGPLTWRRALALGAAFGVVLGIGFGFRNDLLINVVPWAAVVLLCLPGSLFSNVKLKALCLAVSMAAFAITARPILTAYSRGSNSGHVALLGLMSNFDAPIGVAGSIYNWGYFYNDGFANRLINSFTYRQYGRPVGYVTPEYDRAMFVYIFKIVRHFPADFVARAYGSTLRMLDDLPFSVGVYQNPVPYGIHHPAVTAFYDWQMSLLRRLHGMGAVAVAVALLVISARSFRAAVTLLLFLIYFTGYPAIQFHARHFFHLEFIAWWALAFLIEQAAVALWRLAGRAVGSPVIAWRPERAAVRVGAFAVTAAVLVASPLFALRWYQSAHLRALLERSYLRAEREPVAVVKTPAPNGRVLIAMPALWSGRDPAEDTSTRYVVAEFSPRHCQVLKVPATFRYEAIAADSDFSHEVGVQFADGDQSSFYFFPALYDSVYSQFKGVELAASDADCLAGVSRVRTDRIPEVLLSVAFTPHWPRAKLYQTLTKLETPSDGERFPPQFSNPPSLALPVRSRLAGFVAPTPESEYLAPIASRHSDGSIAIKGYPRLRYARVLAIEDQRLPAGAIVMARGEVRAGGITLGLMRDGAWVSLVDVRSRGEFVSAVTVPVEDTYGVVLANNVQGGWIESHFPERLADSLLSMPGLRRENDVLITSLGWAPPASAGEKAIP